MSAAEKLIALAGLDDRNAAVLHNPSNMFYVTEGYTGEGSVFISGKRRVIITDFRYTEQAERQAPGFRVVMTDSAVSNHAWIARLCQEDEVAALRCEEDYLTVTAWNGLRRALPETVALIPMDQKPEVLRGVKTEAEIDCIRRACAITSQAFDQVLPRIREGMTEKELQIELDFLQLKLGAQGNSFDTIMAFGENGSLCHAIPGERRLKKGDMITMDFGCRVGGYCSDMTRTVAFGEPSAEMRKVYETVRTIQQMCKDEAAPGVNCRALHEKAVRYIDEQGYVGRMGHGLGHSLGIDIHEDPRFAALSTAVLTEGIVITVEPGIYLPGVGGVRIEDTVAITANGCESLTTAPRELIIL